MIENFYNKHFIIGTVQFSHQFVVHQLKMISATFTTMLQSIVQYRTVVTVVWFLE